MSDLNRDADSFIALEKILFIDLSVKINKDAWPLCIFQKNFPTEFIANSKRSKGVVTFFNSRHFPISKWSVFPCILRDFRPEIAVAHRNDCTCAFPEYI